MDLTDLLGRPPPPTSQWSVAVVDLGTGAALGGHDPERLLRAASIGKIFVLVELAAAVARGDLDLLQPVRRGDTDAVLDSGLWHTMLVDTLPAGDLARLVGAVSDNWATNALIRLVGLDAVKERARTLAPGGTALHDYVRDDRLPGMPETLSEGSAADWVSICTRLERSDLVGPEEDAMVRDWLGTGVDHSMVLSALSLDPLVHSDVTEETSVWNKTGAEEGVRGDVGVVRGSVRTVAYAVLCNWETSAAPAAEVLAAMRGVGEVVRALGQGRS